ncbi:hypothetical protein STAQ_11330 [Allostella sp. ATCC 35155]|nr:hypothetical protein STAQ_11330 [Stella sp. ATCC 35155]
MQESAGPPALPNQSSAAQRTSGIPAGRRLAVLVLGMHRSGTSVLTRAISLLGAALPSDLSPPGPYNPEGFWEPVGLQQTNDRLLRAAGSAWLDVAPPDLETVPPETIEPLLAELRQGLGRSFGDAPCFVLKDPRLCRMVPLYRSLLGELGAEVRVVLALRDPVAVAASLHTRNRFSFHYGGLLWAGHMLAAERESRDLPRIVVRYDDLIADWRWPARRIARLLAPFVPPAVPDSMPSPVRAELRHHAPASGDAFDPALGALLRTIHDAIAESAPPDTMDALAAGLAERSAAIAELAAVEFRAQLLIPPHTNVPPSDPLQVRSDMAAGFDRLYRRDAG